MLDWRQLTKLKSTYTDALQEQINRETGRVHTSYSLSGAQTGRLASTDPNLMNIPIRTEIGRRIRDAFIAEPGYRHAVGRLQPDRAAPRRPYLRRAAAARRPSRAGDDIHNMTAQELFGDGQPRHPRARPRRSTSPSSTASRAGAWRRGSASPPTRRRRSSTAISSASPASRAYIGDTLADARETGFTTTLFGRKTHFPRIKSKIQHERQGAERAAINAPIQGTAADIIKRAMARMGPALAAEGLGGRGC